MTTTPQTAAAFEDDLPVVDALDQIDHFRIITKSGESRKATPAQVRELCGVDYSILTEQAIPGEFAYNGAQVKSQVYTRSFIATASDETYTPLPLTLPATGRVIDAFGSVLADKQSHPIGYASIIKYTSGSNSFGFVHKYSFFDYSGTIAAGAPVYITLKYVK